MAVVVVCLFLLWDVFPWYSFVYMFVVKYGSQSFLLSIFSNQRVLLTQQKCQTRIRLIILMCMIWPLLEKKACHYREQPPPGPRSSPLSNLRSKRYCAVQKQRTRNKSQRPREKWRKQKSGEGVGKKEEGILSSPPPPPSFIFFGSRFISRAVKTENLPRSFLPRNQTETLATQVTD